MAQAPGADGGAGTCGTALAGAEAEPALPIRALRVNPSTSLALTSVAWDAITLFCLLRGQQRVDSETFTRVSCFGVILPASEVLGVCTTAVTRITVQPELGLWDGAARERRCAS